MSTLVDCPSCSRPLRVPEDLLGQQVKCPSCGTTFQAAEASGQDSSVAEPAEDELEEVLEEPRVQRRPQRARYAEEDEDDDYPRRRRLRKRRDLAPHRGTLVLVLGILSLFVVQFVLGPIAWILANQDLKEMRAGRMDPEGESNTNTGRICAIIGTCIGALSLCWSVGWLVFIFGLAATTAAHHP